MSSDITADDQEPDDLPDTEAFSGYLVTVEVCIETPEGEVAENLCEYIELEFDHAPTMEEIGLAVLQDTTTWVAGLQYGGRFQDRFGQNPTVTLGNIIYQRI